MRAQPLKVISASRRVDLAGFYPQRLIETLSRRCQPERVHSLVLWTKNPRNLLEHHELRQTLERYDHLFLHLTVTGMGGSYLESGIPSTDKVIKWLPGLIELVGDPRRLRVRFDPIVHLRMPDGSSYTNLNLFHKIAGSAAAVGISRITISWMEAYDKVVRRLAKYSITPIPVSDEQRERERDLIFRQAESVGVGILGCCVEGLPVSRCIDGNLLTTLHPDRLPAPLKKAGGQRPRCGCTASWDIGWYIPCPGKCLYCYARPVEPSTLTGAKPSSD